MTINKKDLTEAEIRTRYITPALTQTAGWDIHRIREEYYFTDGRLQTNGKRGKQKFTDYLLFHEANRPIGIIEAKDNNHSIGAGMQQALEYAEILDVPFAFSSNGDGFIEHDRTRTSGVLEREIGLHEFPTSDQLWKR